MKRAGRVGVVINAIMLAGFLSFGLVGQAAAKPDPVTEPAPEYPSSLPLAGAEGHDMVQIAALISVVAGGSVVTLRSRRSDQV